MERLEWVETYDSYKSGVQPVWFIYQKRLYQIKSILSEWVTPEGAHFKVKTRDDGIYELFHRQREDYWELSKIG